MDFRIILYMQTGNKPLAASKPKLWSSCSNNLLWTKAPSKPALEAIVNVGAYDK